MPSEIALVVNHVQSGGRHLPHLYEAEIIRVYVDGVERAPKDADFSKACTWLQDNGYVPEEFRWMDVAGRYFRRRMCVYKKEAAT